MTTESVDPRFLDIDAWPVADAVAAMAAGQAQAIAEAKRLTRDIGLVDQSIGRLL